MMLAQVLLFSKVQNKSACKEGNVYKAMILMSYAVFNPDISDSPLNLCLSTSVELSKLTFYEGYHL